MPSKSRGIRLQYGRISSFIDWIIAFLTPLSNTCLAVMRHFIWGLNWCSVFHFRNIFPIFNFLILWPLKRSLPIWLYLFPCSNYFHDIVSYSAHNKKVLHLGAKWSLFTYFLLSHVWNFIWKSFLPQGLLLTLQIFFYANIKV